ncbi:MAG: hypothetical protein HZA83_03530 [Thaumarchaeota archaeon]|nr:hypothetical protein [Nitrososphaerota archaeon]
MGSHKGFRGFVITLSSLGLIVILVAFSGALHNNYLSMERALIEPRPLLYAAFLADSVAYDVNAIAGPALNITQTNDLMHIFIVDTVPDENFSSKITAYENFLETTIANETHAEINANFSNISSGMLRVLINEKYNYTNNQSGGELLFTANGGTNATSYEINITIIKIRASLQTPVFDPAGNMNVSIRYTDLNGTGTSSGKVYSNQVNNFILRYTDGSEFRLNAGRNSGSNGALWALTQNLTAMVSFSIILPKANETEKIGYMYDAMLEYVQGKIRKTMRIAK